MINTSEINALIKLLDDPDETTNARSPWGDHRGVELPKILPTRLVISC